MDGAMNLADSGAYEQFSSSMLEGGIGFGNERFPCSVCGKSYLRKRHLQRHMRDECIGIPPRFSCDLCPSKFRRKYHMVRHLTSKHGIPAEIAQQTTGNSNRQSIGPGGVVTLTKIKNENMPQNLSLNHANLMAAQYNDDSPLPENLTMRADKYEQEAQQQLQQQHQYHHHHHEHHMGGAAGGTSPSHITSGDSGSDCNGGVSTAGNSPIPPAHIMPMPRYGLTGAITAISAAAAHVEEKDAKILLEAAAAAAAAAQQQAIADNEASTENNCSSGMSASSTAQQTANNNNLQQQQQLQQHQHQQSSSNGHDSNAAAAAAAATYVKAEPLTPNKTAALNMLDDEWKMKLSLQLISNSLLKERLMNTMPFAYQNN